MSTPSNKISYRKAANYWSNIEPSIEGMLGGFGTLTELDCTSSTRFLTEFATTPQGSKLSFDYACGNLEIIFISWVGLQPDCLTEKQQQQKNKIKNNIDCGAGIGRVSKNFLLKIFKQVDLVEQCAKFLEEGEREYLKEEVADGRVGSFFPIGLQEFQPVPERYDMIWSQWVLGHLTDDDLLAFFLRCKAALKPNGVIGVKENVCPREIVELDDEDSSVTRPAKLLEAVFEKAGLQILKRGVQTGFPKGLYPVNMYILQRRDD
ncbi:hypothetical protein HK100_009080 [Physocladia obscura]|uniref:Alpha N-terminal protein methyltransferase 1 n=1 Tax=Physocladia obscura TaxID=109957 RepID=A0AAD5T3L9_9FUNG|nr:hypothetical protein HK100_009080 [Physocladia obscura]